MRQEANPAAWHSDPSAPNQERLWAGESWTPYTRPVSSSVVADSAVRPEVKKLTTLGTVATLLLGLTIVANVAVILADLEYVHYVNQILDGGRPAVSQVQDAIDASDRAGIAYVISLLAAGVVFIWWFHRAYRNLSAHGITDLRFGSGWAIGGWLVPFLNLARPKAVANDIWKGSDGIARGQRNGWSTAPIPSLLNWWWGCWIAGSVLAYAAARMFGNAALGESSIRDALQEERTGVYLDQLASLVLIVAAVLAIVIVRRISAKQDGGPQPDSAVERLAAGAATSAQL